VTGGRRFNFFLWIREKLKFKTLAPGSRPRSHRRPTCVAGSGGGRLGRTTKERVIRAVTPAATLRAARPDDEEFLCAVYASTRTEELAAVAWDDATKAAFLRQQFRAQRDYYAQTYEGATYDVILVDERPAGRLYVARWPDEIRVMDISLLPEHRGRGVGAHLMTALMDEARAAGKRVSIHVEKHNRARTLYHRLGFEEVEDRGVYDLMEWRP
jgi:ribosomal protein S18 acetylase RimI-like enzyme